MPDEKVSSCDRQVLINLMWMFFVAEFCLFNALTDFGEVEFLWITKTVNK